MSSFDSGAKHRNSNCEYFVVEFDSPLYKCEPGLPDFSWSKHLKTGKIYHMTTNYVYQMAIKYKKWPQTTTNGHKMYKHFPFKGPPKTPKLGFLV
jgi:hypothetical protein